VTRSRRARAAVLLAAGLVLAARAPFLPAQEPAPPDSAVADPCSPDAVDQEAWLDWIHTKVHRTVCGSALWFDSFFGDVRVDDERDATFIRVGAGASWDNREGWDADYRFRAKLSFPNLEDRLNLVLGRGSLEEVLSGEAESFEEPAPILDEADEEETAWLLGLGYVPLRGEKSRIGLDAGVRLRWPPDPYLRANYRLNHRLSRGALVRFRQTVFWESVEGFGTTSRLDVDRTLGPRFLLRLRGTGTVSERAEGLRWQTGLQLYQYLGSGGALRWEGTLLGETGREVPFRDARLRLSYRRSIARDWFFMEVRAGVHWPRDELEEERRATPEAGLGFEIASGDLGRSWFW